MQLFPEQKLFVNKNTILLIICVGSGFGLVTMFAAIQEQVLCPIGYSDVSFCITYFVSKAINTVKTIFYNNFFSKLLSLQIERIILLIIQTIQLKRKIYFV